LEQIPNLCSPFDQVGLPDPVPLRSSLGVGNRFLPATPAGQRNRLPPTLLFDRDGDTNSAFTGSAADHGAAGLQLIARDGPRLPYGEPGPASYCRAGLKIGSKVKPPFLRPWIAYGRTVPK